MRREFRDRDYIRTKENFFFCVVGPYHPPDRVISYVKYIPARSGRWVYGKTPLKRILKDYTIPSLLETFILLRDTYPHYLFYSDVYGIEMSAVPKEFISKHYIPERKLEVLFHKSKPDKLQRLVTEFVSSLSEISGVPKSEFGVTGSVLLDIHNPEFSDIDLTVYGRRNSVALKRALREASAKSEKGISCLAGKELEVWCERKTKTYPLNKAVAMSLYLRKWNIGKFYGTNFSIHPVKTEEEVGDKYGDKNYVALGELTIRATISEDLDSMFLPAVYEVGDVDVVCGGSEVDVESVVSYESLYADLAGKGERIEARGKLEKVTDNRNDRVSYRVLVGSPQGAGREYIIPTSL